MVSALGSAIDGSGQLALATVVRTRGSTPRKKGARLLIDPVGGARGTVGGGCGEAEVFVRAQRVLATGVPELVEVNLLEDEGWESSSICGGLLDVWVERFSAHKSEPFLSAALASIEAGGAAVAATILATEEAGSVGARAVCPVQLGAEGKMEAPVSLVAPGCPFARKDLEEEFRGVLHESALPAGHSGLMLVGAAGSRFWVESLMPRPELVVVGAGHVGAALARMASLAGFAVVVLEDRVAFAHPERLPGVDRILVGNPEALLQELPPHPLRHIVLVTRGHRMDARCLAVAAELPAVYRGMIGSRRRVRRIREELTAAGVSAAALDALDAPIGLEIGAETPGEIAVAILAEIIARRAPA